MASRPLVTLVTTLRNAAQAVSTYTQLPQAPTLAIAYIAWHPAEN